MCTFDITNMDASPIQSGSKCGGSDFSIERILSDKKDSREESEGPEWLCCTRYHPPRLPRAASLCRSRRAGRHARVPFTAAQAAALEAAYARAPYLAPPALKALAAALQLRDDRIKIWFQNRRARERREKCAHIAPPQGVTLRPTTMATSFPSTTWIPQSHGKSNINAIDQAVMTAHRFDYSVHSQVLNLVPAKTYSHTFQNVQRFKVPEDSDLKTERIGDNSLMSNHCDRELDTNENRPSTPLDIETVED